jgi:hypothetical protein
MKCEICKFEIGYDESWIKPKDRDYIHDSCFIKELRKQIEQMKNCQNCPRGYLGRTVHMNGSHTNKDIINLYLKYCVKKCKYFSNKYVRGKEDNWKLKESN